MAIFTFRVATVQVDVTAVVVPSVEVKTFVEALADDLDDSAFGTKGTDIFFDQWPDVSNSPCVVIRDVGGQPTLGAPRADYAVQFWVRADDYETARRRAAEIFNRYHGVCGRLVTGYRISRSIANSMPSSVGEDDHRRSLVTWTMQFLAYATDQGDAGVRGKRDPNEG